MSASVAPTGTGYLAQHAGSDSRAWPGIAGLIGPPNRKPGIIYRPATLLVAAPVRTIRATVVRVPPPSLPGPEGPQSDSAAIDLPGLGGMVRHAWPHILEGAVLPTIVFYIALWLTDVWGALIAATAWSYLGLIRRTFSKSRVGGLLLLTALTLTVRLAISALSGSPLVYFLQPAVAKLAVGVGLVASLGSAEPMLQRLTGDVVPMSSEISSRPCVRRFFKRAAIAWALVLAGHAAFGVWLLFSVSIHSYVAIKMVANFVVKGGAVAGSMWWFRRRTA